MKLVVIVLNKTECLEPLLEEFSQMKLQGATTIDSQGMMHQLAEVDELRFIGNLRRYLNPERKSNKTIFLATSDKKVPAIIDALDRVTGGLDQSDTAILFTLPIDGIRGFQVEEL